MRGMCSERASLPISTWRCHTNQRSWEDRHNRRPTLPSEVPVGTAAVSPSWHSQSGTGSSVICQRNHSASALVKNTGPLSSTGGPAAAPPSSGNNKFRPSLMDPMAKCRRPPHLRCELVGQRFSSSRRRALQSSGLCGGSLVAKDRSEFVREMLTVIRVRLLSPFHL